MTMRAQRWLFLGAIGLCAPLSLSLALGQQPLPAPRPQAGGPPAAAKQAPARETQADSLRQRIEQLEEQLVEVQVAIGTLESLAKGVAAPVAPGRPPTGVAAAISASDAGRLDALETQIRAMAAQLEQMQEQIRALEAQRAPLPAQAANEYAPFPRAGRPEGEGERAGFGAVTVSPDGGARLDMGSLPSERPRGAAPLAPSPPPIEGEEAPKQLYETAYGYLLQRDYGAAEAAFDAFLKRHPNDALAGNAQYWLGETLYVRGQYRAAAGAFLKGYQTYSHSPKAPESLLKLAMSLQRLGQKDAACSSFGELSSKYPNAPQHVKTSAQVERQRAGC